MKINATSFDPTIASIAQGSGLEMPLPEDIPVEAGDMDSYIPGVRDAMDVIPSANYTANGVSVLDLTQPVTSTDTDSSANTDSALYEMLSQSLRANVEDILSTMESLGLTTEDLSNKEALASLANAMNEGAAKLGLPQVENLDEVVEKVYAAVSNGTYGEATGGTETDGTVASGVSTGVGGGSGSEDETTSEIVTINGVTYLETTTTSNGITTTTRTKISETTEV
ncbi:MAG: hypothetical protein K6E13_10725 [Lachnospiraceae bacterium]|nr:hypothetical protein [Lachnospiraceae bacterium]